MRFEKYYQPTTVAECVEILKTAEGSTKLVAGGTDVVPKLRQRVLKLKNVIGLEKVEELKVLNVTADALELGASTLMKTVETSDEIKKTWPALSQAAGSVSVNQVRNIATVAGNVCNASPSADFVQGLIVYEAMVNIAGAEGERQVPIIEFFTGPGKSVLKDDEVVVSFTVKAPEANSGAAYKKYAIRDTVDLAIVGCGANLAFDGGKVKKAVVSLAAVAATPIRVKAVEDFLVGKEINDDVVAEAAAMAADNCTPISDQRATAGYRKEMVKVWTAYALKEAAAIAK